MNFLYCANEKLKKRARARARFCEYNRARACTRARARFLRNLLSDTMTFGIVFLYPSLNLKGSNTPWKNKKAGSFT